MQTGEFLDMISILDVISIFSVILIFSVISMLGVVSSLVGCGLKHGRTQNSERNLNDRRDFYSGCDLIYGHNFIPERDRTQRDLNVKHDIIMLYCFFLTVSTCTLILKQSRHRVDDVTIRLIEYKFKKNIFPLVMI